MNFIVKMMDDSKIEITADEFLKLKDKEGLVWIPSIQQAINTKSISQILSKDDYETGINREDQREGMLHDGTRIIKHFGQWCIAGEIDEHGKPTKVIDPQYYPEIAKDCVPTSQEYYQKYAHLPLPQRRTLIDNRGRTKSNLQNIGGLLENYGKTAQ